ncbi:MAG: CrtK protein, membrane protein-like protein [Candidatus Magasanikbacteria bacterium GW2011_GWC2_37_14]|uniref:CrtK protein, membrane protein-like protein n=1 Tax=Candidatus Magasanikbacteria bacterium GW2011_GWC2_37_14 TaxID=1619046 RepID=A0A0G0JJB1_9BACT|nr:MAG: CrtK protein, membrane protein-like protein [Candidatus Magasanikbacteria bacterium GW2011_GWC2_37_14]
MTTYTWYQTLIKPSWAPPGWIFGPVWSVLYVLIAISFGTVFYKTFKGKLSWLVALPFALNIVFNLAFSPIQFGLQNNLLAALDIILVLGTLIWAIIAIVLASLKLSIIGQPGILWIAYIQIPYLLWVSFATVLQLSVTYLNWK